MRTGLLPALPAAPSKPRRLTGYLAFAPQDCDLETLVAVAGSRWPIEHAWQEVELDNYEVRSVHGRYRHVTLALWALLAVVRAADLARPDSKKRFPGLPSLATFRRSRGLAGG